jgi:hypothetical protein
MIYNYDNYGWLSATPTSTDRITDQIPPSCGVGQQPNWTGSGWICMTYTSPPILLAPIDPTQWLIDIGPFFDRFGAAMIPVLTSTDLVAQALVQNIQARKWVDLKRLDVAGSLAYLGGATITGLGTMASPIIQMTATLQNQILTTPVTYAENMALKKSYFSH